MDADNRAHTDFSFGSPFDPGHLVQQEIFMNDHVCTLL